MSAGSVVLVKFPFTHLLSAKKRPALVLHQTKHSSRVQLVTLAMITSKVEGVPMTGDVLVQHWSQAGLLHPSAVRLAKIATVEIDLIHKTLGTLAKSDLASVRKTFCGLYKFWID